MLSYKSLVVVGAGCLLAAGLFEPVVSFAGPGTEARGGGRTTTNRMNENPRTHSPGLRAVTEDSDSDSEAVASPGNNNSNNSNSNSNNDDETASMIRSESRVYFDVLQDAVHRNSTEASLVLLSKITELRQSGDYSTEEQEDFLNTLLALGPDARLPVWTRFRPLARFSKRARMMVLRKTLDRITPPASPSEDDSDRNDTVRSQLQRRRRALVSLVRSLSSSAAEGGRDESKNNKKNKNKDPAIVALEKKAARASRETATDLTARRPEGLETPDYDVIGDSLVGAKNVEIRRYKPYSVCAVSMSKPRPSDAAETDQKLGSPELKGASSFGALAGYLFGKNDKSTAMKMTTPVFTTNAVAVVESGSGSVDNNNNKNDNKNDADERQMEFVLPSNFWGTDNLSGAPLPLEGSGVTLQERTGEDRAVLMFGGYASKKEVEKRKKELVAALSSKQNSSKWKIVANTESLAQYNDPFTVPWKRLNEVSVKVVEGK